MVASDSTRPRPLLYLTSMFAGILMLGSLTSCRETPPWPPGLQQVSDDAPVLSPEEALKTFFLPPGYGIELVAAEPLVQDPVAIDFDADGRMWVVEMRGYMPNVEARSEDAPTGMIAVLEDTSGDGRMDKRTVFLDSLVLPRAIRVLDHGVLVAAPPYLWLARDLTGNLVADEREVIRDDYGDPDENPEHIANGLLWGLDNWIHNAHYPVNLRFRNGTWEFRSTLRRGQWGVSMDDYGRLYRNFNEDPLRVDLVPHHYFARNPNMVRTRGLYERAYDDKTVWPVRRTPGVNRGYRDQVLREDGRLAAYTAAGAPVVYRGDRLPAELRNNVFVTEPAGNLVQRFVVGEDEHGFLLGRNPYEEADFLASTDERFRPVNLYSAPDGTLYVVDMYRGIIQHRDFLTDYLRHHIREKGLEEPLGLGRIYRIVHRSTRLDKKPRLSAASPAELVSFLSHPNGWWRDAAQRLLVERQARDVIPALRDLATSAEQDYVRLHALWTLDGLAGITDEVITSALGDPSPHVRSAAVRISESRFDRPDSSLPETLREMASDGSPAVRRQLAASAGSLDYDRRRHLLLDLLVTHGADTVLVDAAVSSLHGVERSFLTELLERSDGEISQPEAAQPVELLAAAVVESRVDAEIRYLSAMIGEADRLEWQRLALLAGMDRALPEYRPEQPRFVELEHRPEGLIAAMEAPGDTIRRLASDVEARLLYPGKPVPEPPPARPLTAEEQRRFDAGRRHFVTTCAACHNEDGSGIENVGPSLIGTELTLGHPRRLIRVLLHGLDGDMLMPPAGGHTDEEIAEIITYIRRAWGHTADPVQAGFVREIRGETTGRTLPWTREELEAVTR